MSIRTSRVSVGLAAILLLSAVSAGNAGAGVVANWVGSSRSWNDSHMTSIKTAMQNAGNRVDSDAVISSAALNISSVLVIGEPSATPTAAELALLHQFVLGGGMVFVFGDTGIDLPTYNDLLAGIGSTITYTPTTIVTTSALADGPFTLSPWKISGSTLSVSPGNGTTGGTLIDNSYVRFEQLGNGYVVAFGDRIDHNDVISDTNTKLLLNLASFAVVRTAEIPAVSVEGLFLIWLLIAGLGIFHIARPDSNLHHERKLC
jgi:hypothetical protein